MAEVVCVQGRQLSGTDLDRLRQLIGSCPGWSRWRLSRVLCEQWNWRNAAGELKDMAARSLLLKLQARGLIVLPAKRRVTVNRMRVARAEQVFDSTLVECSLAALGALEVKEVSSDGPARGRVAGALSQYHYLGYGGTVGENLQYRVSDAQGGLLACVMFGSAAWKCRERDAFIGWTPGQRQNALHLTTNNNRFLILPWVKVPHLASWILGQVLRRLSRDWQNKYGHPIVLVETFVERDRFRGTAYRAANWMRVGTTTGRTRQDRHFCIREPVKDIYLYPMNLKFRRSLCL